METLDVNSTHNHFCWSFYLSQWLCMRRKYVMYDDFKHVTIKKWQIYIWVPWSIFENVLLWR